MSRIVSFRDLIVWQKSMQMVTEIYKICNKFPDSEKFGLSLQMKRSAVSIPSNIAEGYGRNSTNDYIRFLQIAISSLYEFQTQLEISKNLNYISENTFERINKNTVEIEKMLNSELSQSEKKQAMGIRTINQVCDYIESLAMVRAGA